MSSLNQIVLGVSDDTLGRHPKNSSKDAPQLNPPTNQSQGRERGENLIQISEIHTHTPLPIFLLYYHSVSQPVGVKDLLNCSSLFQLVYFYPYCLSVLLGLVPRRLLTWCSLRIHIQLMTYESKVNP